ncbi:hypothetical protein G6514_010362 [Epicoccum nigrum]|nr:hypothetical protein G6514_010362 [Epicoccum nigrum]
MNTIFTVPNELLFPISSELMEDPVMTIDGFTYERKNIERWLYSRRTSPLTNLELSSSGLRSDALTKEKINAYVSGRDIYTVQTTADTQTVSMKTPLRSYTMVLPRTFVLKDLYELAFRKTMGRYPKFELRHKNAVLSTPSTQTLQMTIAPAGEVFIKPLDSSSSSSSSSSSARTGAMCLIKMYDMSENYSKPVCSYWEPKDGIKTLASVVFRYYRQFFSRSPYHGVRSPFTIWHSVYNTGDGHHSGNTMEHWNRLSGFLNSEIATGSIYEEPFNDDLPIRRDVRTGRSILAIST